jgi:hypothetical protein
MYLEFGVSAESMLKMKVVDLAKAPAVMGALASSTTQCPKTVAQHGNQ